MDTAYAALFSKYRESATLACDELGIVPKDLLYKPLKSFKQSDSDNSSAVLVRYTLNERARQHQIRQVLIIRNKIVLRGNVSDEWKKRCQLFPNAPRAPRIPKVVLERTLARLEKERERNRAVISECSASSSPQLQGVDKSAKQVKSTWKVRCVSFNQSQVENLEPHSPLGESPSLTSQFTADRAVGRNGRISKSLLTESCWGGTEHQHPNEDRGLASTHSQQSDGCSSFYPRRKNSDKKMPEVKPLPPGDPPLFLPLPRSGHSPESLAQESKDLERYRYLLSIYALDSAALLEKYLEEVSKGENGGGEVVGDGGFLELLQPGEETSSDVASRKNLTKGSGPALPLRTPKERRLEVFMRAAKMQLTRNMDEFRKTMGYIGEMDEIGQAGSIEANLRARVQMSKPLSYERYMQMIRERGRKRELRLQQEENDFLRILKLQEKKERSAKRILRKIKAKWTNVHMEALSAKRDIATTNRKRADRCRKMKDHRYRVRLSKVEEVAEEHRKKLVRTISSKRYEHDQEELFRKNVNDKIMEMNRLKKWNSTSLSPPGAQANLKK